MLKKILVTLLVLSFCLLAVVAWWQGYFVEPWHVLNFLLPLIALLALIACIVWLAKGKHDKNDKAHEQEILLKKDTQHIKSIFHLSVKRVKGRGRNRLKTLYDLPWYLLIGGRGDAKSSLLQQNGLEPVLHQLETDEEEQYLKFWSNDRMVVIEVGHRLFDNEGIDEALWQVLGEQLLKYRPRQALNGLISVVGCDRLLKGDRKEQFRLSHIIQEAILTLSGQVGIRLPVYAAFSKADTLADFVGYFDSFCGEVLSNPFGITFDDSPTRQFDTQSFDQKMTHLLSSLADQQFDLLGSSSDEKASSVMAFPYQLSIFLERAKTLLAEISKENRVRESVWLRGAYLLSTGQKGASFDLLSQAQAERSEFSTAVLREQTSTKRSYFVSGLFSKVILPEERLVGVNKTRQFFYLSSSIVVYGLLALFLTCTGLLFKDNWNADEAWRAKASAQLSLYSADLDRLEGSSISFTKLINVLNELREVSVEGMEQKPWYYQVSTQQPQTADALYAAYEKQLNRILLPKLEEVISNELYVYINLGNPSKIFEILRYYQMLFDAKRLDLNDMQTYLLNNLEDQGDISQDAIDLLTLQIDDLFNSHYDKTLTPNLELIEVAANNLEGLSPERLIYSRIKSIPQFSSQVDIRRQLGGRFNSVFRFKEGFHGFLMPEIYTGQGYSQLDLTAKSALLRAQLKEFKMLQGDFSSVSITELTELSKQIQRLYFADYIYRWKELVKNIEVKQFATTQELTDALGVLREPAASPLLDVLEAVVINTTLAVEEQPDTRTQAQLASQLGLKKAAKSLKKADRLNRLAGDKLLRLQPSYVVNEAFKGYAAYITADEQSGNAPIDSLLNQFDLLNGYFDSALSSANPIQAQYNYALAHAQGSQDAIATFSREASNTPGYTGDWVNSLSKQSWKLVINSAMTQVNIEWQNRVYGFYSQAIYGRFPFVTDGKTQVAVEDFSQFFRSEGQLDSFVTDVLGPFIQRDNQLFSLRVVDGETLPLSRKTLAQLSAAKEIQQLFFGSSGQELGLSFRLKPSSMSTDVTEFRLADSEILFDYRHGPRVWSEIQWPFVDQDTELVTDFYLGENRVATEYFTGRWGLIRMLLNCRLSPTGDRLVKKARYDNSDKQIVFDLSLGSQSDSFNKPFFERFRLPRKL